MVLLADKWSRIHAHFLQMGGFKLIFLEDERDGLRFMNEMVHRRDDGHLECVVRFEAFKKLLEESHIVLPALSESEIGDRSKVDNVAKGLVLLQLFWFIAQILARAFQRLAITQLEITTAALATIDIVLYYFWWDKPLNAEKPVTIYSIGVQEHINANLRSKRGNRGQIEVTSRCGETDTSLCVHDRHGTLYQCRGWISSGRGGNRSNRMGNFANPSRVWCALGLAIRSCAPALVAVALVTAKAALLIVTGSLNVALPWDEIHHGVVETSHHTKTSKLYNWNNMVLSRMAESIHYVKTVNESLFYSEHAKLTSRLFHIHVVPVLAGIVFGAIHCLAWNFDFPSHKEEKLWRISSVAMISVNIYVVVGVSALIKLRDFITGMVELSLTSLFFEAEVHCSPTLIAEEDALIFISIIFSSTIHAIARTVLIVLAIMSLRDLPPSALEAIGWSDLIPHF